MKKFSKKNFKNIKKISKSKKLFYKLVSKNIRNKSEEIKNNNKINKSEEICINGGGTDLINYYDKKTKISEGIINIPLVKPVFSNYDSKEFSDKHKIPNCFRREDGCFKIDKEYDTQIKDWILETKDKFNKEQHTEMEKVIKDAIIKPYGDLIYNLLNKKGENISIDVTDINQINERLKKYIDYIDILL